MATSGKPSVPSGSALPSSAASVSSEPAVALEGVTRDFPFGRRGVRLRALDQLTLRIAPGEVFGLLGANGSGKSTTIRILLGLLAPAQGTSRIFGKPSAEPDARRCVGYLPESPYFYHYLTGRELVRFYGRMSGLYGRRLEARTDEVLAWCGLGDAAERPVGGYSKGMLQRVGLAQAVVHDPRLVILDEPAAGLDTEGSDAVLALIRQLKSEGRTVLLTSHVLDEVEAVCDRVGLLEYGRLAFAGSVPELAHDPEWQVLTVSRLPENELAELRDWLAKRDRVLDAVSPAPGRLRELVAAAGARGRRRKGSDPT